MWPFRRRVVDEQKTVNARARWIQEELEALQQKTPEDVAGTPEEPLDHRFGLINGLMKRSSDEVRERACSLVRRFPNDASTRLSAAMILWELGDEAEAIAQIGI